MKNILTTYLLLFLIFPCFAQMEGVLNYKLNTRNSIGSNEVNMVIYFKGTKSIEFGVPKNVERSSSKISETEYQEVAVIKAKKRSFIYKDRNKKVLLLSENIMSKLYLISDTLNNFKWKITSEHKNILGYNCAKATVNFRGRVYTAWFAEGIALPLGPWKFGGLPGLIIKVSDKQEKFVYELTGIDLKEKVDKDILNVPKDYKDDKPLLHSEFIAIYNKKVADFAKMSNVVQTYPTGGSGTVTITLPEKQEKF
ncbi:GLPGLI family protein [Pedobacter aquatilis]|uniref:GLPGLI family protein n=1 Tax=Pedobacter aquatilis TaxID=351343 RepID=UPI0025B5D2F7|nr:GLPGLI family protein [Pedobacter aquatilis]MDN3586810.1 GLPGLI family protein [Pedobacter aquatilis]